MDPFPHDPYESDSGDEGFAWAGGGAGGAVSDARTLTEHAKALMRGDLEVSPLVTNVPPMPEYRPSAGANPVPGIPSTFRGGVQQLVPKKRKIDPQAVAHAFVGESQEVVLPEPSGVPPSSDQQSYFQTEATSPSSAEAMKPPPPPGVRQTSQVSHPGADMLAILTTAASQSKPLPGAVQQPKIPADVPKQSPPGAELAEQGVDANPSSLTTGVAAGNVVAAATAPEQTEGGELARNVETAKSDAPKPDEATSIDSSPAGVSAKAVKRKSLFKGMKKVLVAKKEREIADAILADKADLLDVLPREDCFFLGEEFWIFTVAQLSTVLGIGAFAANMPEATRSEFLETLILKLSEETGLLEDAPAGLLESEQSLDGASEQAGDKLAAARERARVWKQKIGVGFKQKSVEDRFPLDGPISCLFPRSARNFLASAKVKTLYEFLSLKKTETGAICDFLKVWRRECKLPELPMIALAKHLIGISQRVESAIAADQPLDAKSRTWMIDPIIVLTGAAHDFLVVDQGILSASEFVEARTKDLALKLAEWRGKNHMVPLKGSGKVAMISGWKAAAREALEAESHAGKVLTDVDLASLVALENPIETEETDSETTANSTSSTAKAVGPKSTKALKASIPKRSFKVPPQDRQVQYALNTKLFLYDVLGEPIAQLLEKAGIMTAADFFGMSPQAESKLKELTREAEGVSSEAGFAQLIEDWNRKLNGELERMVVSHAVPAKDVLPPAKKARTAEKRGQGERRNSDSAQKSSSLRHSGDPFESLSMVTKRFLATMEISTAEEFLTTRTTDIATKFVEFRIKEGMPELKGLGAIASVSGWKANVRKAARDMGKEDIVVMEPENRSSWGPHSRTVAPKPRRVNVVTSIPIAQVDPVSDSEVLDGSPRLLFAVQSESDIRYRLDVSLRRSSDSSPLTMFVTYRGSVLDPSPTQTDVQTLEITNGDDNNICTRPVMNDAEYIKVGKGDLDSRLMFPGTQGGVLVFLSPYGVRPVATQDLRTLKSEIQGFVMDGRTKASTPSTKGDSKCNVVTRQNPFGGTEYYLYVDKAMEKGQCLEICFKKLSYLWQSCPYRDAEFQLRHLLVESLGLLSRPDLRQVLAFLEELRDSFNFKGALTQLPEETNEDASRRLKVACASRRRLHWVATKVVLALQDWHLVSSHNPVTMATTNDKLYFGPLVSQSDETSSIPAGVVSDFPSLIRDEVKQELLAAVDLDKLCGSSAREAWCPLFTRTFYQVLDCILDNYLEQQNPSADKMLESLSSCLSSCVSVPVTETLEDVALAAVDDFAGQVVDSDEDQRLSQVFACEAPEEEDAEKTTEGTTASRSVVFCSRRNVESNGRFRISQRWYREGQWGIAMTLVTKAGMLLSSEERHLFMHPRALYELKCRFLKDVGLSAVDDPSMELVPTNAVDSECPFHEPKTTSFFFGLVWPKLRAFGWRLEAGETPSTVTFFAPDIKVIPTKRSNPWKQRRDVMRTKLARETTRTGLGNLTKLTKRIVVSVVPHPEGDAAVSEAEEAKGITTTEALQKFLFHVQSDLQQPDTRDMAERVVDLVKTCFNDLAPSMTSVVGSEGGAHLDNSAAPSDRLSCDYLLRFLLVLPSILRQSDLPLQEINDCTEVVSQLVNWMTMKYVFLFDKKFYPSKELYAPPKQPKQTPPDLSRRLKMLHSVTAAAANDGDEQGSGSSALVMKELIRPEDKSGLTDFLVLVLNQAMPCRATEHDVAKKYRRINVGYPGFVCRHCLGRNGEGRYFFSTIESLTTASTVFEKHVGKCKHVPDEVKAAVIDAKTRHIDQRKQLPVGSQQAYFNKLWDRLRSCQIEGSASGTYVLEGTATKDSAHVHESTEEHEFHDHRDVLDFLHTHAPWKSHPPIVEALNQYYGFVEYCGRVYSTPSMPPHFSPEWLLRKVGPKPKVSRKKRLMPG